jgi:hypothetical protein
MLDSNENITFAKNNRMNGPVIMLGAYFYDSLNNCNKFISAHSNVGFTVYTYEYDNLGNKIKTFAFKEPQEKTKLDYQFNPYQHIEKYSKASELENDSLVKLIINSGEKNIVYENTFNKDGKELQSILFESNRDTSQITRNTYDSSGNRTHFQFEGSLGSWNYYYTFDSFGNELSSKRVNSEGDTSEVNIKKYDKNNNRIEDVYYMNGNIQHIQKFFFKNNKLMKEEYYDINSFLLSQHEYSYDTNGNISTEKYTNYKTKKISLYHWSYFYK